MQVSLAELEAIATSIAIAAGLNPDAISLWQNPDGSFSGSIFGVEHSGPFEEVLSWLAAEARAQADLENELPSDRSSGPARGPGMSL